MSRHLGVITGHQWSVKMPSAVRYLERKFIDAFFADGTLQLTTLARCKQHEDASRRDNTEGTCNFLFSHGDHMT